MEVVVEESFGEFEIPEVERRKLMRAADVHGYRGASRRRHNGVVPIRPCDGRLLATLAKLLARYPHLIGGTWVKVVAHVPSGLRLVGVLIGERLHLLGAESY